MLTYYTHVVSEKKGNSSDILGWNIADSLTCASMVLCCGSSKLQAQTFLFLIGSCLYCLSKFTFDSKKNNNSSNTNNNKAFPSVLFFSGASIDRSELKHHQITPTLRTRAAVFEH